MESLSRKIPGCVSEIIIELTKYKAHEEGKFHEAKGNYLIVHNWYHVPES